MNKAAWLAENLLGYQWIQRDKGLVDRSHWRAPDGWTGMDPVGEKINTGTGMLEIIEAMRERGFRFAACGNKGWTAEFERGPIGDLRAAEGDAETLLLAVIEAAYQALQEKPNV